MLEPFYVLDRHGRGGAFAEIMDLRNTIKRRGASRDWAVAPLTRPDLINPIVAGFLDGA